MQLQKSRHEPSASCTCSSWKASLQTYQCRNHAVAILWTPPKHLLCLSKGETFPAEARDSSKWDAWTIFWTFKLKWDALVRLWKLQKAAGARSQLPLPHTPPSKAGRVDCACPPQMQLWEEPCLALWTGAWKPGSPEPVGGSDEGGMQLQPAKKCNMWAWLWFSFSLLLSLSCIACTLGTLRD